ncbi:MAG TPA: NADH-quinone oxidoreductase subunit N [Nocardioidaceae bacterium]|nr:NADH-quinone oxidoreductase subunit N [Nocardioidaceae bacterium]
MRPLALLPEIVLLSGAVVALLSGSFLPRRKQWGTRLVTVATLVLAAGLALPDLAGSAQTAFEGTYAVDTATGAARLIATGATLLIVLLGVDELADDPRESETYVLLLLATLGTVVLAGTNDLLLVITGYLLATIPLYGLVGLTRTAAGAEAAMKTYLFGALLGISLMLGVTVLYGVGGATAYSMLGDGLREAPPAAVAFGFVAVLGGLLFKAGGVPGHFWVPDAAQGASSTAAAFLTTVPKVGALVAAFRLVSVLPGTVDWAVLVAVLAVVSMTLGNLAAFAQTDPRRLLGWSTVSQVGYLLVPVAVADVSDLALPSLLVFLAGYAVTNVTTFAVVAAFPQRRTLASYRGLAGSQPWVGAALLVSLLGLVGTPPTAVFVGKLTVASAAWDGGAAWLAVAVMVNSVASLFYYLRWIIPAYQSAEPVRRTAEGAFVPQPWAMRTAVAAGGASLIVGLGSGAVWAAVSGPMAG